ncbi:MAG: hypothetical protein AVDCRST_MAG69-938, partial [uncultured Solirubrobacteraceae bacterium]
DRFDQRRRRRRRGGPRGRDARLRLRARAPSARRLRDHHRRLRHDLRRLDARRLPPRRRVPRAYERGRRRADGDGHPQVDPAAGQGPRHQLPARAVHRVSGPGRTRRARGEGSRAGTAARHGGAARLPVLPRAVGRRGLGRRIRRGAAHDAGAGRDVDRRSDQRLRPARLPRRRGEGL